MKNSFILALGTILFVGFSMALPSNKVNKRSVNKRSLFEFAKTVRCQLQETNLKGTEFIGYGCWCGMGGNGNPVDEIDQCCKVHDNCYDNAADGQCPWPGQTYWDTYELKNCEQCETPENDGCEKALCQCDVNAAKCFKRNLDKMDLSRYGDYDKDSC